MQQATQFAQVLGGQHVMPLSQRGLPQRTPVVRATGLKDISLMRQSCGVAGSRRSARSRGLDRSSHFGALLDGALGVQLSSHVSTTNQRAPSCQRLPSPACNSRKGSWPAHNTTLSTGRTMSLTTHGDVQTGVVDLVDSWHAGRSFPRCGSSATCGGSSRWSCPGHRPLCWSCAATE